MALWRSSKLLACFDYGPRASGYTCADNSRHEQEACKKRAFHTCTERTVPPHRRLRFIGVDRSLRTRISTQYFIC
jgi:hypothetical protein